MRQAITEVKNNIHMTSPIIISGNNIMTVHTIDIQAIHTPTELQSM